MSFSESIKNIFKTKDDEQEIVKEEVIFEKKQESEVIYSPLKGDVVKLSEVNDPTFAQEIMGKGIAIEPSNGRVVSPVNGIVAAFFNTKHAIAIQSDKGAEILIHIGIDTVELEGNHFTANVEQGDRVSIGDLLVEFDVEAIKKEGYDVVTSIIITNTDKYIDINGTDNKEIIEKDCLIDLIA